MYELDVDHDDVSNKTHAFVASIFEQIWSALEP